MEFLVYLTASDKEILNLLYKAQYSVEENTPLCLLGDKFFGFFKKRQKTVVICTKNAIDSGNFSMPSINEDNYYNPTKTYITRALRHEAVHVAQNCKQANLIDPIRRKKIKLHPYKTKALEASTVVSGNRENELEAYWMEDRPKLVKNFLKKYCL